MGEKEGVRGGGGVVVVVEKREFYKDNEKVECWGPASFTEGL